MELTQSDLLQVLIDLGAGDISVEEAARRAHILDTEPGQYNCGTCEYFRRPGECHAPYQPARVESAHSVRCNRYSRRDPHAEALPLEQKPSGSRKWK